MTKLELIEARKPLERFNDVLLITGDGATLPDDVHKFYSFDVPHDTMCIGRSIKVVKSDITHYADVDADEGKWVAENLHKTNPGKVNGNLLKHTIGDVPWFDIAWDVKSEAIESDEIAWHGSTAFFGVLVGLEMGYSKIILAGCPLDSKGHWYYESVKGPRWKMEDYQQWFEFLANPEHKKVKSMSGYTKILLHEPTKEFF